MGMNKLVSFVSRAFTAGQSSGVSSPRSALSAHRAHDGTFTIFSRIYFLSHAKYGQFHELLVAHKWIPMQTVPILVLTMFNVRVGLQRKLNKNVHERCQYERARARSHKFFGSNIQLYLMVDGPSEKIEWNVGMNGAACVTTTTNFSKWLGFVVNIAFWVNSNIDLVDRLAKIY